MSKVAKSFRLNPVAVKHLDELSTLTGSNQAAIVEQSLAIYRSLLVGGLAGPRRILASTTLPEVASTAAEIQPKSKRPQRLATQRLIEARGEVRRSIARELAKPAPETPEGTANRLPAGNQRQRLHICVSRGRATGERLGRLSMHLR